MTDLHPHWHATADDGEPVRVTQAPREQLPPAHTHIPVARVSRMPAAAAGIAIVVVVGIVATRGWDMLGQLSGSGSSSPRPQRMLVHITASGSVMPPNVTVKAGDEIDVENDETIPNILTSKTLHDGSGSLMNTQTIFPNSVVSFLVWKNEKNGIYSYSSSIDPRVQGTVTVASGSGTLPGSAGGFGGTLNDVPLPGKSPGGSSSTAAANSAAAQNSQGTPSGQPVSSSPAGGLTDLLATGQPAAAQDQTDTSSSAPAIPTNPYTVGSSSTVNPGTQASDSPLLHSGAPRPLSEPKTGPELWIVVLGSIALFFWSIRRYVFAYRKR